MDSMVLSTLEAKEQQLKDFQSQASVLTALVASKNKDLNSRMDELSKQLEDLKKPPPLAPPPPLPPPPPP
eukprot:CAMPEP_0206370024 /NCGR_PEP_ID=MMETSP0294-20121207/5655_1 /ASSEMBLY_ACC=CAM_ASM_000327 /TAXON_ID=39354 /ORGANISM="Heterosigma akashiwo, Strain CCMP2393" /LENGTH=69 /DNA_ID=CAMNT_0053816909 /DNA_START=247 /DNA_END=452 /DNA_ORIENTATION=+